jgi:hypothetical protein
MRTKCADWIHLPSGRRYNVATKPPKSMRGNIDDVRNMFDDETGEQLHQVRFINFLLFTF